VTDTPHEDVPREEAELEDGIEEAVYDVEAAPEEDTLVEEVVDGEVVDDSSPGAPTATAVDEEVHPDTALAAERLLDLQRLQAEYVNYKKRVDRDRAAVQERAILDVIEALLPVLDDIHGARQHGDLTDGPFAAIAEKLEQTLGRFRVERYGEAGEAFDPMQHEALMHTDWDPENPDLPKDADTTLVVQVLQPGYRVGDRVVRPARVSVSTPD
jgi:molecular chaperone GrpE